MNRRDAIKAAAGVLLPMIAAESPANPPPIKGVLVFFYPPGETRMEDGRTISHQQLAKDIAEHIGNGSILCLPVESDGTRLWDFKIEGGDPGQVTIQRRPA